MDGEHGEWIKKGKEGDRKGRAERMNYSGGDGYCQINGGGEGNKKEKERKENVVMNNGCDDLSGDGGGGDGYCIGSDSVGGE